MNITAMEILTDATAWGETIIITVLSLILVASQVKIFALFRANKLKSVMIFELQIEDQLGDILRNTVVDRAVLAKIHNGGGQITVGSTKKISILCEPEESLSPHTKETYTNYPLDRQYRKTIIEMIEAKGSFVYNTVGDLEYGMLRRRTEADHIQGTLHYFIRETATGVYFVFLGTTDDPNELLGRPDQHNLIEEKIQKIRNLCEKAARRKLLK